MTFTEFGEREMAIIKVMGNTTHPHLQGVTKVWKTDLYHVMYDQPSDYVSWRHVRVLRRDRHPIHSWADMQEIKNFVLGPNTWGIEIYPPVDRLIDGSHTYHIWGWTSDRIMPALPDLHRLYKYATSITK